MNIIPDKLLTIVIPMAGNGSRFSNAGYTLPKPLIDVRGKPMIARVMENIRTDHARFILITRRDDMDAYPDAFAELQSQYGCEFIAIDKVTEGAACTVLHAVASINNNTPLLLANSDQLVDCSIQQFIEDAEARGLDGSILTFHEAAQHPKWSYAVAGAAGLVTETREKDPISTHATVGIYWFARGRYFVESAVQMIACNDRCNNEFYVCPVYNYLIRRGMKVGMVEINKVEMHGLGTPEDLNAYLAKSAA